MGSASERNRVTPQRVTAENAASIVSKFRSGVSFSVESEKIVRPILDAVRLEGDEALVRFTEKFDGPELKVSQLRVTAGEIEQGYRAVGGAERKAIRKASKAIRDFHKKSLPRNWSGKTEEGITVGERFYPIRRAGLYVPGGRVPLVSTVLMTALPALAAGVPEIVVCTPPGPEGRISDGLLAAFRSLGISEVYRIGGAQAIGAMAFGTKTIPAVDMIAGPGNAFVMEAKRQVFGRVGIDLLPGPSEVMVIADSGARADWVAADLLSQAEHGTGKEKIYLSVENRKAWERIQTELELQLGNLSDGSVERKILETRLLVGICQKEDAVIAFANAVAPEHLELQVASGKVGNLTKRITTAGAILQGYKTPTVLGDFVAGPSHTLPTDGTGRFSGGLQAVDFLRRSSLVRSTDAANRSVLPTVEAFSSMESLPIHADSLKRRVR